MATATSAAAGPAADTEAVFVELMNGLMDKWLEPLRRMKADGDPVEEVRAYVRRKVQMSREMPRESRLFANEILQGAPRMGPHLHSDLKPLFEEKCAKRNERISRNWAVPSAVPSLVHSSRPWSASCALK